jgi:hypothetical protein
LEPISQQSKAITFGKARSLMTLTFRNLIRSIRIKDFVIEIIDDELIIGDNKNMTADTAEMMAKFLSTLSLQPFI